MKDPLSIFARIVAKVLNCQAHTSWPKIADTTTGCVQWPSDATSGSKQLTCLACSAVQGERERVQALNKMQLYQWYQRISKNKKKANDVSAWFWFQWILIYSCYTEYTLSIIHTGGLNNLTLKLSPEPCYYWWYPEPKKKEKKEKKIKWSHTKCLVHGAQNKSNKTLFLFTIARFARLLAVRFSCSWLLIAVSGPKFYRNRRQRALLYRLALQPFYFYFPFNAGFVPATTVVKARQKPHLLHGFNAFMKKKKKQYLDLSFVTRVADSQSVVVYETCSLRLQHLQPFSSAHYFLHQVTCWYGINGTFVQFLLFWNWLIWQKILDYITSWRTQQIYVDNVCQLTL